MIKVDIITRDINGTQVTIVGIEGENGDFLAVPGIGHHHVNTSKSVWVNALNGPQRQGGYPKPENVCLVIEKDRWFLHVQSYILFEISTIDGMTDFDVHHIYDVKSKLEEIIQETLHGNLRW